MVHVANLQEGEYRQLDPTEATVCHIAARPGGARCASCAGQRQGSGACQVLSRLPRAALSGQLSCQMGAPLLPLRWPLFRAVIFFFCPQTFWAQKRFSLCLRCSYADLNGMAVRKLYQRGLVWLEVPVRPEDHLSIPPLEASAFSSNSKVLAKSCRHAVADEQAVRLLCMRAADSCDDRSCCTDPSNCCDCALQGFVSNKTAGAAAADPLETLLYQIFVAASDRVTVAKLADILNVDVPTLRSVAQAFGRQVVRLD